MALPPTSAEIVSVGLSGFCGSFFSCLSWVSFLASFLSCAADEKPTRPAAANTIAREQILSILPPESSGWLGTHLFSDAGSWPPLENGGCAAPRLFSPSQIVYPWSKQSIL